MSSARQEDALPSERDLKEIGRAVMAASALFGIGAAIIVVALIVLAGIASLWLRGPWT